VVQRVLIHEQKQSVNRQVAHRLDVLAIGSPFHPSSDTPESFAVH